jgi:hypothetical protein
MPNVEFENGAKSQRFKMADWKPVNKRRLVFALIEEVTGGYSVVALNLLGAASQGVDVFPEPGQPSGRGKSAVRVRRNSGMT